MAFFQNKYTTLHNVDSVSKTVCSLIFFSRFIFLAEDLLKYIYFREKKIMGVDGLLELVFHNIFAFIIITIERDCLIGNPFDIFQNNDSVPCLAVILFCRGISIVVRIQLFPKREKNTKLMIEYNVLRLACFFQINFIVTKNAVQFWTILNSLALKHDYGAPGDVNEKWLHVGVFSFDKR